MRQIHRLALAVVLLEGVVGTAPTSAQSPRAHHVIVVERAPRGGAAVEVHVLKGVEGQNFIYVGPKATATDLEAAIETLKRLRAQFGDTASSDIRAVPRSRSRGAPPPNSARERRLAAFEDDLKKLARMEPEHRPGLGRVRAFDLITGALGKPERR